MMSTLAHLKAMLADERIWTISAHVAIHEGQTSRFDVNEEGDLIVSCYTNVHHIPVWANANILVSGSGGNGVWTIPPLNAEVMLASDSGDFEGELYIVSCTSGGFAKQLIDAGFNGGETWMIGKVIVRSISGSPERLVKLSEFNAFREYVRAQFDASNGHVHVVAGAATTTIVTGPGGTAPTPDDAPTISGTDLLRSE